jgi:transcriptional regulator with XRE-family HTH domain
MRTQADGEAIRQLREELGLSITQLAERAGLSLAHMCRLENEDRHGSAAARSRVAKALGTTISTISKPVPRAAEARRAA